MANSVCEVLVTEKELERPPGDVDLGSGAIVEFWGVVRRLENEREIEGIEYEAHRPMAEHQLREVGNAAVTLFGLTRVVVRHRIGFIGNGEPSLFLQVKAPHRVAAFDASKWIVDELKKRVPIWKRPRFSGKIDHHASRSEAATTK
jgi:molybdopterin synthase catalytic subunit